MTRDRQSNDFRQFRRSDWPSSCSTTIQDNLKDGDNCVFDGDEVNEMRREESVGLGVGVLQERLPGGKGNESCVWLEEARLASFDHPSKPKLQSFFTTEHLSV